MTKSSVNFKSVKSAGHAVSHASREVAPTYLLPNDKSMGTMVLLDDIGKVAATLEAKLALASRQALREKNYSPVWEGVLNLRRPEPGEDAKSYRADCSKVVTDWYKRYEASTGHKVLRVDVHLDEGHMVDGEAVLNAHAHVIADRTNDLGRVIQLSPKMLRELQTLTAEVTGLERGKSSLETGRKHIEHQAYKYLAERGRLETQQVKTDLERQKRKTSHIQKLYQGDSEIISAKDAEIARYKAEREALKASGEATQKDYQALKKAHEAALAELKSTKEKVGKMDAYTKKLESDLAVGEAKLAAELVAKAEAIEALVKSGEKSDALLKTATGHRDAAAKLTEKLAVSEGKVEKLTDELVDVKAKFATMATAYQEEKARGTPAHLIQPSPAPKGAANPPAPSTRGGETAVVSSERIQDSRPHGAVPHTPEDVQRLRQRLQTATEQPKTQKPDIRTTAPEKSLGEALKASVKEFFQGWVDFIKHKGFTHAEVDVSKGQYRGVFLDKDDFFAVQKTGRSTCVIHELDKLDQVPEPGDMVLDVKYRDGVGQVSGQNPEQYKHPGMGKG